MIKPYYISNDKNFYLLKGDCIELMTKINHKFDMVFADPPYFLSNDGISVQSGKIVSVNKGDWDKSHGFDFVNDFNKKWLTEVRNLMKENATIWISGTMHNIFSVAQVLQELNFKILNIITWQKTNPPPNISCRYFTHSTEHIIWARKQKKVPHFYNYELMKELNGGTQMKDVWTLPAIAPWEKNCTKHPTQKPLSVLTRLILSSTKPNNWILDPFSGASSTGIAANLANRRFLGIEKENQFLDISICRKKEIQNSNTAEVFRRKISGFITKKQFENFLESEPEPKEKIALGFCRKKDLKNIFGMDKFYFHAIEQDNLVKDFPIELIDTKWLYLYEGARGKPKKLTGHVGEIENVTLKHKSKIRGKEKSKTEFYYEVSLKDNFSLNGKAGLELNPKTIFNSNDFVNIDLFKKSLPSVTTKEKIDGLFEK